jgi:hypothetical protein
MFPYVTDGLDAFVVFIPPEIIESLINEFAVLLRIPIAFLTFYLSSSFIFYNRF